MGTCKDCIWCDIGSDVLPSKDFGFCRKRPPLPGIYNDAEPYYAAWPMVILREDWCGQLKESEK